MTTRSSKVGTGPRIGRSLAVSSLTGALLASAPIVALLVIIPALSGQPLLAQEGSFPFEGAVGIRVTPTDVRLDSLEADLDLTMYTRVGPYPSSYAGFPTAGFPAIDYGDGSTLPTATLVLASSGGGPGGSNVYRNLASFTHTYPSRGVYTVTAATYCTFCVRSAATYFPAGSPNNPTSYTSFDYVPQTVIGNLAGRYGYSGTTSFPFFSSYSVRYLVTYYLAVTNTARIDLQNALDIPTTSTWGLALLGGLLLLSGVAVLRHA